MKILVFDTETTGLPEGRNPSIKETKKWPHMIQLSYILYDTDANSILECVDEIVKLDPDVTISEESISLHGISRDISNTKGKSIVYILNQFNKCLKKADKVVGHNISFDKSIIGVESIRNLDGNLFNTYTGNNYCTMKRSMKLCKKWAKLSYLHEKLFNQTPNNLHNSLIDVFVCFRCFYKLYYGMDPLQKIKSDKPNGLKFRNTYNEILCKC